MPPIETMTKLLPWAEKAIAVGAFIGITWVGANYQSKADAKAEAKEAEEKFVNFKLHEEQIGTIKIALDEIKVSLAEQRHVLDETKLAVIKIGIKTP